jgi:hypothetical protein
LHLGPSSLIAKQTCQLLSLVTLTWSRLFSLVSQATGEVVSEQGGGVEIGLRVGHRGSIGGSCRELVDDGGIGRHFVLEELGGGKVMDQVLLVATHHSLVDLLSQVLVQTSCDSRPEFRARLGLGGRSGSPSLAWESGLHVERLRLVSGRSVGAILVGSVGPTGLARVLVASGWSELGTALGVLVLVLAG